MRNGKLKLSANRVCSDTITLGFCTAVNRNILMLFIVTYLFEAFVVFLAENEKPDLRFELVTFQIQVISNNHKIEDNVPSNLSLSQP